MGRQSTSPWPELARPSGDAVSLRSQLPDQHLDHDARELHLRPDDLPPLYSDLDEDSAGASAPLLPPHNPSLPSFTNGLLAHPFNRDNNNGAEYYLDPVLSTDAKALEQHINHWASIPPRQYVRIYGWHRESVHSNGKKERKRVTDFDIWAELTPYLYRDAPNRLSWQALRTVEDGELARRGTVFRTRAPGSPQGRVLQPSDVPGPTLEEWCHRFCASSAGLKCFRLERRIVGLDTALLHRRLSHLQQSTNYRGHMEITFPVRDNVIEVYNENWTNLWRLTAWVQWLFYLTLLFLFSWPYLFFRTNRYEVAVAEWPFSRARRDGSKEYVSFSEDQWYGLWARVLHRAILEKRQGSVEPQEIAALDQGRAPSFNTGQPGVDGMLGFIAASVAAFGEVNRQGGWGYDNE